MKKGGFFISVVFLCLVASSSAFADNQQSSTEAYLQELHSQGKERVIVIFKDDAVVDTSLVEKYNGTVIRAFTTSKALVCEVPQENIELLKQEEAIKDVVPDMLMQLPEGGNERDPEERARFAKFKKEYLAKIQREYRSALSAAREEYLSYIREYLSKKHKLILAYLQLLEQYRRTGKINSPIYRNLLLKYHDLLKEYYAGLREALAAYHEKIMAAKTVYGQAAGAWREEVTEMVALSYSGPVTVRWNNLEAGMNSKAAWDNYNVDGTGIKIAFIDTGINYTMENLDDHYLGGHDYIDGDDDPMPKTDGTEDHGTGVASIAVGEGVNQIVGVAYNASYYAVRISDNDITILLSNLISGIEWASTEPHKADIISMSNGTPGGGIGWEQVKTLMENACNNAYNNGIILVAASGNDGGYYSNYPARFDNVISAGGHAEDQTLLDHWIGQNHIMSNGGVDIVAPAERVYSVGADNTLWWVSGTSTAAPHVAGLLALQLQYAQQHNIDVNNGYLWESIKHSAKDMPLIPDPNYEGSGKIWAAETNPPPPVPNKGSVDLMSLSIWPFDYNFEYFNYVYLDPQGYPAYYIGTNMYQNITITNLTDIEGNTPETIENLNVTTIQKYLDTGNIMDGAATENFTSYEPITINPGSNLVLQDSYYLPWSTIPGLDKTVLSLEFKFAGNNRLMKITDNVASIWCPPAVLNEGFPEQ